MASRPEKRHRNTRSVLWQMGTQSGARYFDHIHPQPHSLRVSSVAARASFLSLNQLSSRINKLLVLECRALILRFEVSQLGCNLELSFLRNLKYPTHMHLFSEATPDALSTWRPPSDFRWSYTILSPCIIALVLCVWTALQLNIPVHNKKPPKWDPRGWICKQQWRKVAWLIIGLFAPEMMCGHNEFTNPCWLDRVKLAFAAWAQRLDAYKIMKEINQVLDKQVCHLKA